MVRGTIMAKEEYEGVIIDRSRDQLFDKLGLQRLKESVICEKKRTLLNKDSHL